MVEADGAIFLGVNVSVVYMRQLVCKHRFLFHVRTQRSANGIKHAHYAAHAHIHVLYTKLSSRNV